MENVRDGIEDRACYALLQTLVATAKARGLQTTEEEWVLKIPNNLVGDLVPGRYEALNRRGTTEDPWVVRQQWSAVADAIESLQKQLQD